MFPTLQHRRRWMDPIDVTREVGRALGAENWLAPFDGGSESPMTAQYPVDVCEDDKNVYIDAELPGFKKEEVQITIDQGVLNITAEHKAEQQEKKGRQHLHERRYTRVERTFALPSAVEETKVDARLDQGVLHLTLPKNGKTLPNRIAIK